MQIPIVIVQVPTVWDVEANLATVREVLEQTRPGEVVIFPEGMLSGYGDDLAPLDDIDPDLVTDAVTRVSRLARQRQVHMFCGTLLPLEGAWYNAGLSFSADGDYRIYRKINLAMHERGRLRPGDELPTVDLSVHGRRCTVGIQLCREIRFPEQWQYLASAGAGMFVYLTHAANPSEPSGVWRSHLISRAAENQRFVASANVAHPAQHCPSMVISPRGDVLGELAAGRDDLLRHTVDLDEAGTWYLEQRRRDVLSLEYHAREHPGPARQPRGQPGPDA